MLISFLRTIILYLLLIASIRLMGKRQLGEMEPTEFVVTMLVANLAAVPMQESGIPLLAGAVPILVVLAMELLLSLLSYHSIKFRRSIRSYKTKQVEQEVLEQLLQAGRYTATAKNNQDCCFVFVQNELEQLKEKTWEFIDQLVKEQG